MTYLKEEIFKPETLMIKNLFVLQKTKKNGTPLIVVLKLIIMLMETLLNLVSVKLFYLPL
jgi:hypothetical protein